MCTKVLYHSLQPLLLFLKSFYCAPKSFITILLPQVFSQSLLPHLKNPLPKLYLLKSFQSAHTLELKETSSQKQKSLANTPKTGRPNLSESNLTIRVIQYLPSKNKNNYPPNGKKN